MKPWFDDLLFYLQQHQLTLDQFLQAGGWVMNLIGLLCILLFSLLAERYWFRWLVFSRMARLTCADLYTRLANGELGAAALMRLMAGQGVNHPIHQSLCCDLRLALNQRMTIIRTLISLCPLLGLLGTVSGMIQVFDTLAMNGTGNPRLMAAGIASATLPTLAGMAVSVTGLLLYSHLKSWTDRKSEQVSGLLTEQLISMVSNQRSQMTKDA